MAASVRAIRLLKAMDRLTTKTFDNTVILKKLQLQSPSNGTLQGSFTVDTSMCNLGGSLHGGYIASVTDVLSFYTQLSNSDGRVSWTTSMNVKMLMELPRYCSAFSMIADANVDCFTAVMHKSCASTAFCAYWQTGGNFPCLSTGYIRSAYEGEKISVVSNSVKSGSSPVVETYFHNEKGKLLAKGTTLFLVAPEKYQKLLRDSLDFDVYQN